MTRVVFLAPLHLLKLLCLTSVIQTLMGFSDRVYNERCDQSGTFCNTITHLKYNTNLTILLGSRS